MPSHHHEIQPRDVDVLTALQALPDARPVWKPYVCVKLLSSFSGFLRLDFSLRTVQFQGRTRWLWVLVKTVRLERSATALLLAAPPVKFR